MGGRSGSFRAKSKKGGSTSTKAGSLSADKLEKKVGFQRWTKGGHDRLYINPAWAGYAKINYKGNGKLDGGEIDGYDLLPKEAYYVKNATVYYEVNKDKSLGELRVGTYGNRTLTDIVEKATKKYMKGLGKN